MTTLKSSLRKTVMEAYRARGRNQSNLWLVYSVKTNSDWILPSDRQLIHWLSFLETAPDVLSFDLAPDPILSEDKNETRATELDAIVTLKGGLIEWHEVKAGEDRNDPDHESQKIAQQNAASQVHAVYKRFNDIDLKPKVRVALRWLKAIGYAEAIRDEECVQCRTSLVMMMKKNGQGNIQNILNELNCYDPSVVQGVLVRLAISGVVRLNLEKATFGLLTSWEYHG